MERTSDIESQKAEIAHLETISRAQTQEGIPEELDKIVTRKFDRHIIPWLFGIW